METVKAIQDGAIGDLVMARAYWNGNKPWFKEFLAGLHRIQADVPEDVKHEAELLAAQVSAKAGKHEVALKKVQALAARLPTVVAAEETEVVAQDVEERRARLDAHEVLAAVHDQRDLLFHGA